MKILYFIDSMAAGGKERRLFELIKSSTSSYPDLEIHLIIMDSYIHYNEILELGIHIEILKRKRQKDILTFYKFHRLCKKIKPDIVHTWDSMTTVYALLTCRLLRIPLINGMITDTPVIRNIANRGWLRARFCFPFSTIIVGNSRAGLDAYKAPKKKSVCIYNGIDTERAKRIKEPDMVKKGILSQDDMHSFVVGMVAAFEDRKDYETLIKAAIHLLNRNIRLSFILIGDGKNLNIIKKLVPDGIKHKIHFLGKQQDVDSIVNIFDIGLLLTNSKLHGEGISNSIIEYMLFEKPVLATTGGGTNEIVKNDENGYLIEANNHEQLIQKIEFLIENPDKKTELGSNGKKLVLSSFEISIMTRTYYQLYTKLFNNSIVSIPN